MSVKNRTTLVNDSDAIFLDNTSGQIIPANHRTFNDDVIDSVANLLDDNTFNGVNTFSNLVINKIATSVASASSVDLSAIDGNVVTIQGNNDIDEFLGNEGQIVYIKFDSTLILNAQNGASVLPPYNIQVNNGDVLIAVFENSNQIQILGHWRQNGQQWFELVDVAAFTTLASANALQIGSMYYIDSAYESPTSFFWSVLVRAVTSSLVESTAYIKRNGTWFPALMADSTFDPYTIQIFGETDVSEILTWAEISTNASQPQWVYGSKAFFSMDGDANVSGAFYGKGTIDSNNNVIRRNLQSILDSNESFFGRIDTSSISGNPRFFTHHGKNTTQWGNNPFYESGFGNTQLSDLNNIDYSNGISNVIVLSANYAVVNDQVTINASVYFETKFDQGVAGHEALLYFPLPFINNEIGCGHGALRFESINNHQNIGAIVTAQDIYVCLVAAKWDNAISLATDVTLSFNFTYITDPTA